MFMASITLCPIIFSQRLEFMVDGVTINSIKFTDNFFLYHYIIIKCLFKVIALSFAFQI